MRRRSGQIGRVTLAVFAAYLLVLQGLFGALASGRHAADMIVDRAIHLATCDPAGAGSLPPTQDHQSKLPPCCTQGCTFGIAIADVPAAIATIVAYETFALVEREPQRIPAEASPASETSGRPRAPPSSLRTT